MGGIAHDFNNILTAITANLSLLRLESLGDVNTESKLTDVELAADRGADLVKRLLTFSGKHELNPKPESVNDIVQELHRFAKPTFDARYEFRFDLDNADPYAHVDPLAIEQVIFNLYLNARDAMPDGGIIETKTRLVDIDGEAFIHVWVTDSGPGVSEEIQARIFDPFFTTKAGQAGTGLGLSTSLRLIREQHGELIYQTTTDQRSCFQIKLPIAKQVIQTPLPRHDEAHLSGDGRTVLVVDDEDAIRNVCSLILSKNGFDVLTAVNGEAALEVLSTDHDQIDVVLLDLTMPGMSGSDVLAVIVATYPGIPVILAVAI